MVGVFLFFFRAKKRLIVPRARGEASRVVRGIVARFRHFFLCKNHRLILFTLIPMMATLSVNKIRPSAQELCPILNNIIINENRMATRLIVAGA